MREHVERESDGTRLHSFDKETKLSHGNRIRATPLSPEESELEYLRAEVAALRTEDLNLDREKRKLRRESSPQRRLLFLVDKTVNMVPELMQAFQSRRRNCLKLSDPAQDSGRPL